MSENKHKVSGRHDVRPTIAYLAAEVAGGTTPMALWSGVVAGAQEHDVNLIAIVGGNIMEAMNNIVYDLVTPDICTGIVNFTIRMNFSDEELVAMHARYEPLPMVTILRMVPGRPMVNSDDYQGMQEVVAHLIERHGCRRLAFIRARADHNPLAEIRYRAYRETLKHYEIPCDPVLVTPEWDWANESGERAVTLFLDERKLRPGQDIDALVSASDLMAIGALKALQNRNIRIPEDLALVGFNDSAEAQVAIPAVTSVDTHLPEQGRQAVSVLKALSEQSPVPEHVLIPARLVVHESCGCLDESVVQAGTFSSPDAQKSGRRDPFAARRKDVLQAMLQAVGSSSEREEAAWADTLLQAFIVNLNAPDSGEFLSVLRQTLQHVVLARRDVSVWQDALSAIQGHIGLCRDPHQAFLLLGQARTMVGKIASQNLAQQQLQAERQAERLRVLNQTLLTTFDVPQLANVLTDGMRPLGIPGCYLALYEDPQPYEYPQPAPAWSRLIVAYDETRQIPLEPGGTRFSTHQILPEGMWPVDRRYTMILQALYFQNTQIGFVLFEVGPQNWPMYDVLRAQLSSTLQGALLVQRVQERSAEVARQKYLLDAFLANVPDSIYFKDRESRIIRSNQAHAASRGFTDPGELVGKSDFDLFPQEQAQPRYDQEQTIIQTGEPILDQEETYAGERWALISKMPLRDEHGDIIGTFGISHDITALKLAQEKLQLHAHELAAAYEEIHILNDQLQEENLRMSAELDVSRRIQQMVLPAPHELEQIPGLDIVGYMRPAEEVGGDYYDVLRGNGVLHVGIGDVTGHGLESGILMLMTQTAIRTLLEHGETNPVAFVTTLNRTIYQNVQRMQVDKTLTFVLLHYQDGELKVVGQHEDILVGRAGGRIEHIDTTDLGFPVGLEEDIHDWVQTASVHIAPGDGVVLYTDGITEAANTADELYGLERLCEVLSQHWEASAEEIKQAVVDDVIRHIGDQKVYDDLTLVVLKHIEDAN